MKRTVASVSRNGQVRKLKEERRRTFRIELFLLLTDAIMRMVENKVSSAFLRSFSCLFGGENMNQEKINARKERAAILSVVSNSLLVSGKFAVGIAMGSIGILSEAVHSSMDLLASGISWWSVRQSAKPPD